VAQSKKKSTAQQSAFRGSYRWQLSPRRFALLQREGMFRFDSTERANWESAAGMSLKVFDVGSGSIAGLLERLHWAVAIFAAHDLIAFCERFVESAR
jgi:hypothetical protein